MPGIIVGVDGSGHSQRALEWAMEEAAVRQAPLTVITVHQLITGYFGGFVTYPDDQMLAEQAKHRVQAEVDKTLSDLAGPRPPEVTVKIAFGSAVEELVKAGQDADLLVVGSRGAGGFARMMQGSVSSLVTQHAPCPVVIIPPADRR
jgi:nucleotide-binding universal stress UspA family protein